MPRARIRSWVDGDGAPDPARAVEFADTRGWLDLEPWASTTHAAVPLVAWIFAGGSIDATHYRPRFTFDGEADRELLTTLLDTLGLDGSVEKRDPNDDRSRAVELVPSEGGAILGRWLAALGAPVGGKGPQSETAVESLPEWLPDAPLPHRREFCRIYLSHRGTSPAVSDGAVRLREERPDAYLDDLASLIDGCTRSDGDVTRAGKNVVVELSAISVLVDGQTSSRVDKESLLRELWRLRRERSSVPSRRYVESEGEFSHAVYYDHFGSFPDAVRAAGMTPHAERDE